jgi:hypothetical protein
MREPDRLSHSQRLSRRWAAVAVVLLLVGAVCLGVGLRGNHDALAATGPDQRATNGPTHHPSPHPHRHARRPAASQGPRTAYSVPVQLRIPALHMVVPLSRLGLNPDKTVQVPSNPDEPGWFELGPSPGQIGSAVILGHVDSYDGPAVFLMLRFLQPGDKIRVHLADGVVAHFVVSAVRTFPNAQFPAHRVYGSQDHSALALVTCGGDFDTATQKYQANVVVFSRLVRTTSVAG